MRHLHEGPVDCFPSDVNYAPEAIDTLDHYMDKLVSDNKLQCASYILARNGKVFAYKSLGALTYKQSSPEFLPDSIRNIGSVSKIFTAIAIMQLIEEGKIYLHQPVSTIIPEFDIGSLKNIAIFHLLTHTSGLIADPGYFLEPYTDDSFWNRFNEKDWIRSLLTGHLQNLPGKAWSYSSAGYAILGEIIKRVSGNSYPAYVRERIIKPLSLINTWIADTPLSVRDRICFVSNDEEEEYLRWIGTNTPLYSSGGIDSSLRDLNRLGTMFINKGMYNGVQILSRKSVEAMTRNHMTGQPAYFWGADLPTRTYGLGLNIMEDDLTTPGTFGHDGGGRSYLYCDAAEQFIAAWFVPSKNETPWEPIHGVREIIWSGLR